MVKYADLKPFCWLHLFIGTMQNEVSIHDILENARVMLRNSGDIQDTDSDTGKKLQGV